MATNTRKLSDFLAEGSGDTFGDLPVENPHIKPGTLYPAWHGLLDNHTGYTFTDSGNTGHSITPNGVVHHSGAQEKIGYTSLDFSDNVTGNYLSIADHADWNFAAGEWTIEYWFYPTSVGAAHHHMGIITSGGSIDAFYAVVASDNKAKFYIKDTSNNVAGVISTTTIAVNTWYHFAVVRDSNTMRLYINGVQEATADLTGKTLKDSATTLSIGRGGENVSQWFVGYMDEVRITKGDCRYTSGTTFTPSTTAFTSDANTKLLIHSDNGGHVGAYGTAQSDTRSYYYTDIKGSKPIKDPRIGGHFGSQRHKFKSLQFLEQETATHGENVYSVDGREWIRGVGDISAAHDDHGIFIHLADTSSYFEIVGYFIDVNYMVYTEPNRYVEWTLDGGTESTGNYGSVTVANPLHSRCVDACSLVNLEVEGTLGIHTIKIRRDSSGNTNVYGIELIAQDTSNRNNIQIPSQNVVSYGKKFTVSGTPHYNPFATKGDGSASTIPNNTTGDSVATGWAGSTSAYWDSSLDTATSLGLTAWEEGGAFYRPVNGGRVVKWVDSTGTIKTSVNMMPPSAKAIGSHSGDATPTGATNWSTQYLPIFSTGAIDHSQAEVAKTFSWREFGNGNANGGSVTGSTGGSYKDFSMMNGTASTDLAYVMDDGLTSMVGDDVKSHASYNQIQGVGTGGGDGFYITFIGTGITNTFSNGYGMISGGGTLAQNLPYGTHILQHFRSGGDGASKIDGVSLGTNSSMAFAKITDLTFHQPKMPPIPENAVVIADYMLMADYVAQTDAEFTQISKGVRAISSTRDVFFHAAFATAFQLDVGAVPFGMSAGASHGSTTTTVALPFFGTNVDLRSESGTTAFNGGSNVTQTNLDSSDGGGVCDMKTIASPGITLGVNNVVHSLTTGGYRFLGYQVVTPIHTSSHYSEFESPFLKELVGGDRNMEQTNLVVTPDGKTWDELRDTSYLGSSVGCHLSRDGGDHTANNIYIWDFTRIVWTKRHHYNKGIALAYDRVLILKEGTYQITTHTTANANGVYYQLILFVNGALSNWTSQDPESNQSGGTSLSTTLYLERGDYVYVRGDDGPIDGTLTNNQWLDIQKI